MTSSRRGALAALLAAMMWTAPLIAQTGVGWGGFGPTGDAYAMGLDTGTVHGGRISFALHALPTADSSTWEVGQQIVDASPFRGKRIRYAGYIKTIGVGAAGLWIVVNGTINGAPATVGDDSTVPPRRGTGGWSEMVLVLDVPVNATCIRFGPSLTGLGTAFFDDASITVVPRSTRLTRPARKPEILDGETSRVGPCGGMLPKPTNLGFEE